MTEVCSIRLYCTAVIQFRSSEWDEMFPKIKATYICLPVWLWIIWIYYTVMWSEVTVHCDKRLQRMQLATSAGGGRYWYRLEIFYNNGEWRAPTTTGIKHVVSGASLCCPEIFYTQSYKTTYKSPRLRKWIRFSVAWKAKRTISFTR